MEHALHLDHVLSLDAREAAISEMASGRVVDALHLGDRLRVLADFDGKRDVIAAAARVVWIGNLDRRRLQIAPSSIAALRLARLQRENHALGERQPAAVGRLERGRDGVHHVRSHHDVGLHGVVLPLTAAGPVAILFSGVRRRAPLHVDDADLPRLALLIVGEQLREHGLRLDASGEQIEPARTVFDDGGGLRADGADAGAHVRDRAPDERHARGDGRARLARRRIDRAERERGVLRLPLFVDRDAVRRALLGEGRRTDDRPETDRDERDRMTARHRVPPPMKRGLYAW